jgi:hypothetical protein
MPQQDSDRFCKAILTFTVLIAGLFFADACQAMAQEKSLVDRLSEGDHPVEIIPEKSVRRFKEAIDRNYVRIKFTDTRGGTELGMRLDKDACKLDDADFENGEGTVHLEGTLTLDYVKVRCIVDIDVSTLKGSGHLVKQ